MNSSDDSFTCFQKASKHQLFPLFSLSLHAIMVKYLGVSSVIAGKEKVKMGHKKFSGRKSSTFACRIHEHGRPYLRDHTSYHSKREANSMEY